MSAEILPVSIEQKSTVIGWIRQDLIPGLVQQNYDSEKVIKILHRAGTAYSIASSLDENYLMKVYSAFYNGVDPIPRSIFELDYYLEQRAQDPNQYQPENILYKGKYRILGRFSPNQELAQYAPLLNESFTGAMPLLSKDYQNPDTPFYCPPVFNIESFMRQISSKFDHDLQNASSPFEIAQSVISFYFWGLAIVHPFIGGNHRAFDRFIEYAFAKKGLNIEIPQNETLNIPNNDKFNIAIYAQRRHFLNHHHIRPAQFSLQTWKNTTHWLHYQEQLNIAIAQEVNDPQNKPNIDLRILLDWIM